MSNKSINLDQHSYAVMVNNDVIEYRQLSINKEENMLDSDFEPVAIDEPDESNLDGYEVNEVQEIYETDITIDQANNIWHHNAIRYLIYCWSQLRDQFANCPDKKKSLWQLLSRRMVDRGYYFDALACENKWRGLKKVYMFNKNRFAKRDGTKHMVAWSHYYDMDRAIKGIAYELSDVDDDGLRDSAFNSCLTVDYENMDSMSRKEVVDKCHWTIDSTKELIRIYAKERKRFAATNQGSKHLLWEEISQQMSQRGHHYSATLCNDKWRNLKMSYKKNKLRAMKYGEQTVKWFYFKDLDNVLKHGPQESVDLNELISVSVTDDNSPVEVKKEDFSENYDDTVDFQMPEENNAVQNNESNDGEVQSGSSEVWTEAATKQLIHLWGLFRSRFLVAAQGKKRLLWNEISEEMRQSGHNFTGVICDRKWRLLKANYLKRKEKYKKSGLNSIKWQYFQELDRLLGTPIETVAWSMDSTMCLIDCFNRHKDKFLKAATGEKLLIWKQISKEMLQNGYSYSPRACDNKWRTLKNRYNKNRMRADRNHKKIIWVYYDKLDSVLREINHETIIKKEDDDYEVNKHVNENHEFDEHDYIRVTKPDCTTKFTAISELKDLLKTRNLEFDLRLKQMEENLNSREKVFENLQHKTLEALKRSNELETQKLKLLEQLISRLPSS